MTRSAAFFAALPFLVPLSGGALRGDIIVLTNGNEIQGEIIAENDQELVVRFPGGTLNLKRKQVRAISRQTRQVYLLEEADKALRRSNYELATRLLRQACEEEPDSQRAQQSLRKARRRHAAFLHELHRYREALEIYGELLKEDPRDQEVVEEIGLVRHAEREATMEEERADAELRGGDYQTAVWRLQNLYDTFPDRRESLTDKLGSALVHQANGLLARSEWEKAGELYRSAVIVDPDLVDQVKHSYTFSQLRQIQPLARSGNFEAVEKRARRALEVTPSNLVLHYFLALALESKGETGEAAGIYAELLGKPRPRNADKVIATLRRQVEAKLRGPGEQQAESRRREVLPGDFRRLASPHFVVYHRNEFVGSDVSKMAERIYSSLFRKLDCETHWRLPCEIFVHPSKREFEEAVGRRPQSGGVHQLQRSMGAFNQHRIHSYQEQPRLTDGILQHEIGHALLVHRLNYPREIPLWANEGFAVCMEPGYLHAHYRRIVLAEKRRRNLTPLAGLLGQRSYPRQGALDRFYGQSFLLVDHLLRRKGISTYIKFLEEICRSGLPVESALRRHYEIPSILALENGLLGTLR